MLPLADDKGRRGIGSWVSVAVLHSHRVPLEGPGGREEEQDKGGGGRGVTGFSWSGRVAGMGAAKFMGIPRIGPLRWGWMYSDICMGKFIYGTVD